MADWKDPWIPSYLKQALEQQEQLRRLLETSLGSTVEKLLEQARIPGLERLQSMALPELGYAASTLDSLAQQAVALRNLAGIDEGWLKQAAEIQKQMDSAVALQLTVSSQVQEMLEMSLIAGGLHSRTDWDQIASAFSLSALDRSSLAGGFEEMAGKYKDLVSALSAESLLALPPSLVSAPSSELFLAGDLGYSLGAIAEPPTARDFDIVPIREEIRNETTGPLEHLLGELGLDLLPMLSGARASLRGSNPDRARHVSTSLRELFTQVLHRIAPDKSVLAWTQDPSHVQNGRPTRRGRMLYVVREVNNGSMGGFIESDIAVALEFVNLFQKGTHEPEVDFSEDQLSAMLARMEGLLRFLLELWSNSRE